MRFIAVCSLVVSIVLTKGNPVKIIGDFTSSSCDGNMKFPIREVKTVSICTEGLIEDDFLLYDRSFSSNLLGAEELSAEEYEDIEEDEEETIDAYGINHYGSDPNRQLDKGVNSLRMSVSAEEEDEVTSNERNEVDSLEQNKDQSNGQKVDKFTGLEDSSSIEKSSA